MQRLYSRKLWILWVIKHYKLSSKEREAFINIAWKPFVTEVIKYEDNQAGDNLNLKNMIGLGQRLVELKNLSSAI
jgi:hypothetical protein